MALILKKKIKIFAPKTWIWKALTEPSETENWWGESVVLEPKKGGQFKEVYKDDKGQKQIASGKVLSCKKEEHITFTWQEKAWPKTSETECSIVLTLEEKHCLVEVTQTGWESLPPAFQKKTLKDFELGWKYHLDELKSYLED